MKKILNVNADNIAEESLSGFLLAYRSVYERIGNYTAFKYRGARKDKVVLVVGGGSGHEPLFGGFVGKGLADAAACGNVCASPNPDLIKATAEAVDQGKGVIFLYGCYAGDNLNFDMAEEMLNREGIRTGHIRVRDDFLSAPIEEKEKRRGIAGDVFTMKVIGAACDAGLSMEEILKLGEKVESVLNTVGVCTLPCTLPGNSAPTFTIKDDEIVFGMGIHGEKGLETTKMMPADQMVKKIYDLFMDKSTIADQLKAGAEVAVLVNGLGATPLMELNLVYLELYKLLKRDGIKVYESEVKSYCTTQDMGGFSITLMLLDEELKKYLDAPCLSPFYAKETETFNFDRLEEEHIFDESNDTDDIVINRTREGILEELTAEDVRNMLLYVAQKVISEKPYLTAVDSQTGDGDHGIGMAAGMKKVQTTLAGMAGCENVYGLFEEAGTAMLNTMGGASGVIFGSLYLEGARGMAEKKTLTAADLAIMERKSLDKIMERGGAKLGDKTMVDALSPAVDALEEHSQGPLIEAARAAEAASFQGMEDTKKYVARFGRAKSLNPKDVIGHQDAGATSVYLIFRSIREYIEGDL